MNFNSNNANKVVDFPKVHRDKRKHYNEEQIKKLESIGIFVNECDDEIIEKGLKQLESPLFCEYWKDFHKRRTTDVYNK